MAGRKERGLGETRRGFVRAGLGIASVAALTKLGCGSGEAVEPSAAPPDGAPRDAALDAIGDAIGDAPDTVSPTPECLETEDSIEGPYYREGAPLRSDLAFGVDGGVPLVLRGRVYGVGCASPLLDAELDVWQADAEGRYDDDGTLSVPPEAYRLRGKVKVDAAGAYEVRTIVPGHYLNGAQYRPAHLHVKVRASGHRLLTTQLYFEGDPYNGIDPFIEASLIMALTDGEGGAKHARFDFVLATE